jgi:hypothetical protein
VIVIRCLSLANGEPGPQGQYLETYDTRTGYSTWTYDRNKAMEFEDTMKAYAFWTQIKGNEPFRSDGKPNRPLTAFTVEMDTW